VCLVVFLAAASLPLVALQNPDVRIAAASDLQGGALRGVIARFTRETRLVVQPVFGSSGNLFAQIQNGAPFDVYLSADIDYPRRLLEAGLGEPGTLVPYAVGRLVLWTRRDSGIDVSRGLPGLLDPAVKRIAIANPAHAPYGRAAVAALKQQGLYDNVQARLVLGENVIQAQQFAQSGNADVGIVARAVALAPATAAAGDSADVPAAWHPPIEQGALVLKRARNMTAAKQFLVFLQRADIVEYLRTMGFEPPAERRLSIADCRLPMHGS
jgi:molybdate transport system substrate-binding protein